MGQIHQAPIVAQHAPLFHIFICKLLHRHKISRRASEHIAEFAWRDSTAKKMCTPTRHWFEFVEEEEIDKFDFCTDNILRFLEFLYFDDCRSFHPIKDGYYFASLIRKLSGSPLNNAEQTQLKKFIHACFNTRPPIPRKKTDVWDVNILLTHFVNLGSNAKLDLIQMGGKTASLVLVAKMCRLGEVNQLSLSGMTISQTGLEFVLKNPTKTYNMNSASNKGLQKLIIPRFKGNGLICLVTTIQDYIRKIETVRLDIDALFVCSTCPPKPATTATLSRWVKIHMIAAGLADHVPSSCRASSSSTAALSGISVDHLAESVGWATPSTFVKFYMKPLGPLQGVQSLTSTAGSDPHGYRALWKENAVRCASREYRHRVSEFVDKNQLRSDEHELDKHIIRIPARVQTTECQI